MSTQAHIIGSDLNGVGLIAAERDRQVTEEGWTPDHDDGHTDGEMALAAAVYALPLQTRRLEVWDARLWRRLWPARWNFKGVVDTQNVTGEPTASVRIRELTKAGALIAAEIDRLLRSRA